MTSMLPIALDALSAGLSVVPPREDGTKAPLGEWKQYTTARPDEGQLRRWYANGRTGLGFVCGRVSGNVEVLEFEGRAVAEGVHHRFRELCRASGLEDVLDRVLNGYTEKSPSGGIHLMYRVPTPLGNTKLARRPATDDELTDSPGEKVKVLAETRGEGGYIIIAPSHGKVHDSGLPYVVTSGSLDTIADVTDDERDELWRVARLLDQMPQETPSVPRTSGTATEGDRPGDDYNARDDVQSRILELLEEHGWTRVYTAGEVDYLRRPGKRVGVSASLGHVGPGVLRVFTTSTEFEDKAHSPFGVYAQLVHDGDYTAAARDLAHQGYGTRREPTMLRPTRPHADGPPLAPPPDDPRDSEADPHELLVEQETARLRAREEARRRVAAEHAEGQTLPQFVDLDEFLDQPDPEVSYRIEGLWPADGRVLFAAQYKAGKTTSVGNILRALVDGEPLFGTFPVEPPTGRVALIDDELHENTLRRWLRGQGIVNTGRVSLVALRGKLSTFDILDESVRDRWAEQLAAIDAQVVILDCLRPIIDTLGLSEDKDTGRVLTAFDELLDRAGISEGMIVHHMGHTGERSRGDSRLRDWPDAEWKIVRQRPEDGEDDPAAPRYFSAFGRDVEVGEQLLALAEDGRRLYIAGGSRRESAELELRDAVVKAVTDEPGMTATALRKVVRDAVGGQSAAVDKGRDRAVADGLIEVRTEGRSKLHYPRMSTVSDAVQDTWTDPGGERVHVPIGGTGHVTTPPGPDLYAEPAGHGHGPTLWTCPDCGRNWRDSTCPRCEVGQEGAA